MTTINLTGKVALVTGGSRGLGRAICLGFAAAGADVVIASRKQESCDAVAAEIRALGREALPFATHMGDLGAIDRLIEGALESFGHIDILVNNAGISPTLSDLSSASPDLFQKMFDVNTRGPWYLASRIAPKMAAQGGGSMINMISVAALRPPAYQGIYAATKAALEALTKVMAAEWAADHIRVNCIAPGSFHSDMFDAAASIPGYLQGAVDASAMKRIAETDEIIGPILYLASDLSSYTTGSTLVSDGGYLLI
jgi:NAD(P)-dependent dehydrogenase (short-subunit alcohol dehydrogenase family)